MLEERFRRMDTDGSGKLEPQEFLDVPELAQNPLVKRVISVFDKNGDGNISFYEFVMGLAKLSSSGSVDDKLRFAFAIYDIDKDGFISNGELFAVLKMRSLATPSALYIVGMHPTYTSKDATSSRVKMMVGDNLNDVQLQQLVDRTIVKADEDFDGKISVPEFCKMVRDLDVATKLTLHLNT